MRPMKGFDIATVHAWFKDPEVLALAFGSAQEETHLRVVARQYLDELDAARNSILALQTPEGRMVGFLRHHLSRHEGRRLARIGILLGEKRCWDQGYGSEAMASFVEYLFAEKSVDLIQLDTAEFNVRAQRCFEKCGFYRTAPPSHLYPGDDPTPKVWMELQRPAKIVR